MLLLGRGHNDIQRSPTQNRRAKTASGPSREYLNVTVALSFQKRKGKEKRKTISRAKKKREVTIDYVRGYIHHLDCRVVGRSKAAQT